MDKLLDDIKRIYKQQTTMWRSKVEDLQKERNKLKAELKPLREFARHVIQEECQALERTGE